MDAASSVKFLRSSLEPLERLAWRVCEVTVCDGGNRKENFRLLGEAGVFGESSPWPLPSIDRAAISFTMAIAESRVLSSDADIGLTYATKQNIVWAQFFCNFKKCALQYTW